MSDSNKKAAVSDSNKKAAAGGVTVYPGGNSFVKSQPPRGGVIRQIFQGARKT